VKISQGCIMLMVNCNEVQELREQLYQAKEGVKEMKGGKSGVICDI
jgi:toxic protein SymE